jgi:predicted helicase
MYDVTTTIHDVLAELRASSVSQAEKGSKFERLVKAFLKTDPVYSDQFSDVWLWSEWPDNGGKHDTGIDLVAVDRITGQNVAIQAKFYAPTTTVSKPDIDTFMSASGKSGFTERIIVSTTDRWNSHAEDAIKGQQIPVRRIGLVDLVWSNVDWAQFTLATPEVMSLTGKKQPRPHQRTAIEKVKAGFANCDRGKMIMACGTGKTFTSLRLAEETVGAGGSVLFLVPSISLLSQTIREWVGEADIGIRALAVCSDAKSTKRSANPNEDISAVDLALPATTSVDVVVRRLDDAAADADAMTVVFSTYQSIDVVARAQQQRGQVFDLIVCDEAHRTTGTTLADEDESSFVRVHNKDYLPGEKRLYMTATPRIYGDASKAKAGQGNAVLCSMDDEELYGPEFHRLGFGEAVESDLLTDYRVLVLAVDEEAVARTFQEQLSDDNSELRLDDAAKIVGCWNGLAKYGLTEHSFEPDAEPMRRAVAFAGTIKDSKKIEALFTRISSYYAEAAGYYEGATPPLECRIRHVDGTFNALERNGRIDWLEHDPGENSCRILTNARCLSEGVDVPALDAVMFLSPRKSEVDIVQSVGRVMRKAPGKKFGYIILPIGVPAGVPAEQALDDNTRYAAVWQILQALRAHDDRFNAMVNRISLTSKRDSKINVIGVGKPRGVGGDDADTGQIQQRLDLAWESLDELRDALYSKIVEKVGSRTYWTDWAKDVADIAQRQITRIKALLSDSNTPVAAEFEVFLDGLRGNLNENISQSDAIEMLAQHLITRPVFNALFESYDFIGHNPVAQTMERMLNALDEHNLEAENETLGGFYDSVRRRVEGITSAEGRQRIIIELYDTFFSTAFKKTVDKFGIVYTPVEIVDFILRSADEVLQKEFGQGITGEGVHVLDGFAGTGTFIVRLIQSGLIRPEDLARKYANELHANEILLLAYYIAAVNIEAAYHDAIGAGESDGYETFPGLILTDTFQSWEEDDRLDYEIFRENNARLEKLKALPITVIVGNPPYSAGQDSANDNNANERYPALDNAIRLDYSAQRKRGGNNSLYDPYIRAIKWASLRLADRGVIAYVTNGGFLRSNVGREMRRSLAAEFSSIYVFDLRGNRGFGGEEGRKEGRPVFEFGGWRPDGSEIKNTEGGTRATIAIVMFVKNPASPKNPGIHSVQVDDYLSAGQKVHVIEAAGSFGSLDTEIVTPDKLGDWYDLTTGDFETFIPLGVKHGERVDGTTVFSLYGRGLETGRDAWVYQSSPDRLSKNVERTVDAYNDQVKGFGPILAASPNIRGDAKKRLAANYIDLDATRISWTNSLKNRIASLRLLEFDNTKIVSAMYRPFFRQHVYFDNGLNHIRGQIPNFFPRPNHPQIGLYLVAAGNPLPFSTLMVDTIPDLALWGSGAGQYFARWRYEPIIDADTLDLALPGSEQIDGYRRIDNITDGALARFVAAYGPWVTKDDVFHYVYGILHSPQYRSRYAADLRKELPCIPLVSDPIPFIEAGRSLAILHMTYQDADKYPLEGLDIEPVGDSFEFFRVIKLTFPKVRRDGKNISDMSRLVYNSRITLSGIPDSAYRYQLGSRSAVEWLIDRYQITTDKASGIVNDPNDWSREVRNPRYILDLIARIVTVSVETMKIIDALPPLRILDPQPGTANIVKLASKPH